MTVAADKKALASIDEVAAVNDSVPPSASAKERWKKVMGWLRWKMKVLAAKANKWQGRNITRWTNQEYDKAFRAAEGELDPVKRAALFIRMNELVCGDQAVIPVVYRPRAAAVSSKLQVDLSGWDTDMGNLKDWYREA